MTERAPLFARLQGDLLAARRAKNEGQLLLLGTVLADLQNRELEQQGALSDADVVEVVRKAIKRRRESEAMYRNGDRPELADQEAREADALATYLPPAVDDEEIRAAVRAAIAAGAANIGAVMGRVMPQFKGRADGSQISTIAKDELKGQ